jgi:hypothetical protein
MSFRSESDDSNILMPFFGPAKTWKHAMSTFLAVTVCVADLPQKWINSIIQTPCNPLLILPSICKSVIQISFYVARRTFRF